ncbi:hypothetical protein [Kitasatospora sp. NPDC056184]|uniref:hypothetical protein n=1 Tax=Kitasatospora sp. NPDC056184 TaxID=3345738 RepID=UPI0035D6C92F
MRTMHRILAVSAVVLPLAVCGATAASADAGADDVVVPVAHFDKGAFTVGPDGSALHVTEVKFGPEGASYFEGTLVISEDGVSGSFVDTGIGHSAG